MLSGLSLGEMMTILPQAITSSACSDTINEEKLKTDNSVYVWNFHEFSIHLPCNHLEKNVHYYCGVHWLMGKPDLYSRHTRIAL